MKIYMALYMALVRQWFKIRFRYLCWRYGSDFVFRMIERNLVEMGATAIVDTPGERVYKLGSGTVTITAVIEEEEDGQTS